MRVALEFLGCRVNQAEIAKIEAALRAGGHEIIGIEDSPDACIVNTCTVTGKSDYQSRQLIRKAGKASPKVIVTGCFSELNREQVLEMQNVVEVYSNSDKLNIINYFNNDTESNLTHFQGSRTRYSLKVQDGCDCACSYCIIPKARGASRSVPLNDVLSEAEIAVGSGFRELVLTGIHLGSYGKDIGSDLAGLVESLNKRIEGRARIRLSSIEINEATPRLLSIIRSGGACPHLHIPLQSGSDSVLKRMNRLYDTAYFERRIRAIVSEIPDISIGLDVISGFPGETDGEHSETLGFICGLASLAYLHVFPYSERPGTIAATMPGKVPENIKKSRAARFRELSGEKRKAYAEKQAGRVLDVLFERRLNEVDFAGTSDNYLKVRASGPGISVGSLEKIRVMGVKDGIIRGRLESASQALENQVNFTCSKTEHI